MIKRLQFFCFQNSTVFWKNVSLTKTFFEKNRWIGILHKNEKLDKRDLFENFASKWKKQAKQPFFRKLKKNRVRGSALK